MKVNGIAYRRCPRSVGARHRRKKGFTLIELAIATSILMIGLVALISATSKMHSLRKLTRERVMAQNAVRSVAERINSRSFGFSNTHSNQWVDQLLAVYGPGGSVGNTFDVPGLTAIPGAATPGTIQVLTDERLEDDTIGYELGLPRDLNGDGDASDADVTADARILPIILEVRWRGQSGDITLRHAFYVLGY